jgi:hypothetical protein
VNAREIGRWALRAIDQVEAGQPNEDFRVELKSQWPADFQKAARRVAGHANAARSEPVRLRGVSPQAIDRLLVRGRLEAIVIGGRRFLCWPDVVNFKSETGGGGHKGGS